MSKYTYDAIVVRHMDGDTLRMDIDLGFGVWMRNRVVRLAEIDAPEQETEPGRRASEYVIDRLPLGTKVTLVSVADTLEKYGRILGKIFVKDVCLNEELVAHGFASVYNPTKRG